MTTDRHVVITGASGSLGVALTAYFSTRGWAVTGVVRHRPHGPAVENVNVRYVEADLAEEVGVLTVLDSFADRPDLLVHAAAIYPPRGFELDAESMNSVFRVNTLAPYRISRGVLRAHGSGRRSTIVTVNSEAIFHADAASGIYGASKAALRVLTSALADEARGTSSAVASLTLGPLWTPPRQAEIDALAARHGQNADTLAATLLSRSNPDLVIDEFIPLESCCRAVEHLYEMGHIVNGTSYRLDGGSAGSLM